MRREALFLTIALAVSAGCVNTPASTSESQNSIDGIVEGVLDLGRVLEAKIALADGLNLHGTVYLPDVPEGVKVPVIMDLGPYYGNLGSETSAYNTKHPPSLLYEHFLRRGYAIALVSVRGTGLSEGCFMIGGPQERADAAAAVEWLAEQEWSDGNVAMTGVSYDGTTPWEAYVSGAAPHLKAIIPVESISDFYRYSFFEGVPVGGGAAFNTYYLAEVDVLYGVGLGIPRQPVPENMLAWLAAQSSNVCPEQADVYLTPYQTYMDGVHGPYWDERDMSAMVANATAAVFVVHGFDDFNVKMDHVQTIWDDLPEPKRMLLGQWYHTIPWRNVQHKEMAWHQYNATMDQFLDAYVRGDPAALARERAAPPVLVQDSANRTWNLTAWPPVESWDEAWHLAPGGALATGSVEAGETWTRGNVPRQLVGSTVPMLPNEGDLVFDTEDFAGDTLFMGNPWIAMNVTVDKPEGFLEVRLYETGGEDGDELISMGWQNVETRESRDKTSDVPTGQVFPLRILMEAIAQQVEKGHGLRLVVSAVNGETLTPQLHSTTFTIKLGSDGGSTLMLPRFEAPAP